MSKDQVADELAVRSLAAAYTDATNRGHLEGMVAVFTEDAVLTAFGGPPVSGHAAIREVVGTTIKGYEWIFQMMHSGLVSVEGDTASCRWWVTEYALRKDNRGTEFLGLYQDRAIRTPKGWRFAARRLDATCLRHVTFEGRMFPRPSYEPGLWPTG